MLPYAGVILDLDDTLYAYEPCHAPSNARVIDALLKTCHTSAEHVVQAITRSKEIVKKEYAGTAHMYSRFHYFEHTTKILTGKTDTTFAHDLENLYWKTFLDHITLRPNVLTFLTFLKEKNVPTTILTNLTTNIQHQKIARLGITSLIDHTITAEDVGVLKPDIAMFKAALDRNNQQPHEMLMIGDSFEDDILGAKHAHIDALLLLQSPHEYPYRIPDFKTLHAFYETSDRLPSHQ